MVPNVLCHLSVVRSIIMFQAIAHRGATINIKGQLISKCLFGVNVGVSWKLFGAFCRLPYLL